MRNGDYIEAKRMIENNMPITQKTYDAMVDMLKEFNDGIDKIMHTPAQFADIGLALKLRDESLEIKKCIENAVVAS